MKHTGETILNAGDFATKANPAPTTDDVVKAYVEGGQTGGFSSFDGNTTFSYPRLNLDDVQREAFLKSLNPVIDAVLDEY